jgi:hypothetical protein
LQVSPLYKKLSSLEELQTVEKRLKRKTEGTKKQYKKEIELQEKYLSFPYY